MATQVNPYREDEKEVISYVESRNPDLEDKVDVTHIAGGLRKSPFDHLSIPRTLWVFRRVFFYIVLVCTGYVCEGFELGAGSTVIANNGFIKQFGSRGGEGVRALDPTWLSTWSAMLVRTSTFRARPSELTSERRPNCHLHSHLLVGGLNHYTANGLS